MEIPFFSKLAHQLEVRQGLVLNQMAMAVGICVCVLNVDEKIVSLNTSVHVDSFPGAQDYHLGLVLSVLLSSSACSDGYVIVALALSA